jgi:hypothetical protein
LASHLVHIAQMSTASISMVIPNLFFNIPCYPKVATSYFHFEVAQTSLRKL